ncbi:lachesin-like isoform X2 [Panonychus citri]|uniref:lachesin-like isoform X2 n=1 Tax=Panonychus citri TaxID=50023 RepID=UPI002307D804|nr:lachesin-like isoform X2 [Panonychus citri]
MILIDCNQFPCGLIGNSKVFQSSSKSSSKSSSSSSSLSCNDDRTMMRGVNCASKSMIISKPVNCSLPLNYVNWIVNILLKVIICFILIPTIILPLSSSSLVQSKRLISGTHGIKNPPKFIGSVENVTIPIGKEATLKCNVDHLGNHKVLWLRADPESTQLLTLDTSNIAKDYRLRVTNDNNRLWSLHIKNVTESDRGTYMCEINSEPMINRKAFLDILVPPSIVDNETSSDVVLDERSKLSLRCRANGYPTPTVIWRREDGKNLSTGFIGASKVEGEYLNISQVTREDMGAYLCIASNGVLPSRSKRIFVQVNFSPKIRAVQLSVGAVKGSHVDLQCEIEASPRPLTSWIRKDVILLPSNKYKIIETFNGYNITMKLRINDLEDKDFAAYICVAKNPLGEREGRLRVYDIPAPTTAFSVPVKSTSSTHKPPKKVFTALQPLLALVTIGKMRRRNQIT